MMSGKGGLGVKCLTNASDAAAKTAVRTAVNTAVRTAVKTIEDLEAVNSALETTNAALKQALSVMTTEFEDFKDRMRADIYSRSASGSVSPVFVSTVAADSAFEAFSATLASSALSSVKRARSD